VQYCNLATEEAEERARAGEKNGFIDRFEVTAPNSSFILLEGKPKRITHKSQRVSNSFRPFVRPSVRPSVSQVSQYGGGGGYSSRPRGTTSGSPRQA